MLIAPLDFAVVVRGVVSTEEVLAETVEMDTASEPTAAFGPGVYETRRTT